MDNARYLQMEDNTDMCSKDAEDTENVDIFPFICGICFEKFRWLTPYLDHFHLHNQGGIAKQLLGVKIIKKADLQRVELECTKKSHISEDTEIPTTNSSQNKESKSDCNSVCSFHCSLCGRRFPGVCQFNEHFVLPRLNDKACIDSGKGNESFSEELKAIVATHENTQFISVQTVTSDKQRPISDCPEANEGFLSEKIVEDSLEKYQKLDLTEKKNKHEEIPCDKQLHAGSRLDTRDVRWNHEDVVSDCLEDIVGSSEARSISVKHQHIGIIQTDENRFKPLEINKGECENVSTEEFKDSHSIDKTECKEVDIRDNAHKTIESACIVNDVPDYTKLHSEDHTISHNTEDTVDDRDPNIIETITVNSSVDLYNKNDERVANSNEDTKGSDPQTHCYQIEDRCLKDEKIPCDVCGVLSLKKNLRRHVLSHNKTKPYECDMCQKLFKTKDQLYGHKLHHKTKKDLICDHCGKGFNNGPNLRQHMKIHTRGRTLACPVCSKTFPSNYILKDHISRHSDNKPYMCEVCGKAFRTGNEVQRHLRVHSDDRPHACWQCEKTFKSRSNLIKHAKTHTREVKTHR